MSKININIVYTVHLFEPITIIKKYKKLFRNFLRQIKI